MTDMKLQDSLESLVLRSMADDLVALEILMNHHQERIIYYIMRIVRDRDRAEDIMQNVWIQVYQQLSSLRNPNAFSTWLYRIARTHICRELRRTRREVLTESLEEFPEEALGVDERMASEDELEEMHRGLDLLSAEHREVLILRFMDELSYQEIAEITGCSIGTVRSRIHYAKQSLAEHLKTWRE